jgi:N-acetyl-beta-hexosaminidase
MNATNGQSFLLQLTLSCRVVQPPIDQRNITRLGVFAFCMTDDNVKLSVIPGSPVLERVGVNRRFEDADAPTMLEWRKGRTAAYGQSNLKAGLAAGTVSVWIQYFLD